MTNYQRGYGMKSGKPAYDDDDMAAEFLNSSGATYLAADKLPGPEQRAAREAEMRRQELLQQMRQIEDRTLESSKRSLGMLHESEKVGVETAEELVKQREQLENTEKRLVDINSTLKDTQKNINGIKSVFSSLKTWWNAPKQKPEDSQEKSPATSPNKEENPEICSNHNLGAAYEKSQMGVASYNQGTHPALLHKGFDEENEPNIKSYSDFRANSQRVNVKLDADLDNMALGLSRLKGLAHGLGTEIEDQNAMIERVKNEADKADLTIGSQNTQMKKLLKK